VDFVVDILIFVLLEPLLNALMMLYALLFHNMALAIVALTVIVRVIFYPLTIKQLRSSARMQALQPKMQALRTRYKDNPQAIQRETMKLYREAGISPLGCLGPMVLQMPIWFALYYAIIKGLGNLPGSFVYLSQHLYSWLPVGAEILPLNTQVPWVLGPLDLAQPDPTPILPLLVAVSTWAQQKIMQPPTLDPQQRQQQQIMLFMFPIMLGFFAFQFPSGLALYWLVSNVITVGMQGLVSGWGNLRLGSAPATAPAPAAIEARPSNGPESRGDREDGGGGNRQRPPAARTKSRRRRNRRP
jgi:YidC/Oxa1 family membrane protein insertase